MDQHPSGILVFLLGAIGATAPEIVRLYGKRQRLRQKDFPASYYLVSAAFMVIGGVVAVILPAVTYWAAFYAGGTMPATVSTFTKHHYGTVALSNERGEPVECSNALPVSIPSEPPKPALWKTVKETIQDHADRLFY